MPNNKNTIIQNIVIRPIQRQIQDITKWRNAMRAAEATVPRRIQLYDLYADIILDAVLSSSIEKRVLNITRTQLRYFNDAGEEVEEITKLIELNQFHELRKEMAMANFWGISVIELDRKADGQFTIYSVPRKHIHPQENLITWEQTGTTGINYKEPPYDKYVLQIGKDDDLGLLLKAAPYVLYKRGSFGDWAQFSQMFGMPFREARYDGFNDQVRQQLEKLMELYGSAPYAILPKEAEFELHEVTNTAATGDLYDNLRAACNQEISILINGQTETTLSSQSSGYAQSKTHARTEEDINASDRMNELFLMNEKIEPILANLGYPVTESGYFDHILPDEDVPKKDQVDIIVKLRNNFKLPIDDDYVYERFGIPKPERYEELKREAQAPPEQPTGAGEIPPEERELTYWQKLRLTLADFFDPGSVS